MHEATRNFCCRTGFVLFCLLPTLLVGGWIGLRKTKTYDQWRQAYWSSAISQSLGVSARVDRVEEPSPGKYILHGVALIDPDAPLGSPPLAKSPRVQVASSTTGLVVLASEGEVDSVQLPRLWAILHERLLRGPSANATAAQVSLSSLVLRSQKKEQTLSLADARLQLTNTSRGARGAVEFRLAGASGEPARMSIERFRQAQPVATKWSLHSGDVPLPCSALAACLPELARLGDACAFHGNVVVESRDNSCTVATSGHLLGIYLPRLLPQHFASGSADLTLTQASWRDGRVVAAAGEMRAVHGTLRQQAWRAASDALAVRLDQRLTQTGRTQLRYGELAFSFDLSDRALWLAGTCAGQPVNTLLVDQAGQGLLGVDGGQRLEPLALVHFLAPDGNLTVPATAEALQAAYWLPLPPAEVTATAADPQNPLR